MASSKTVFRPRWVSAEHSKYFTESEEGQWESRGLSHGEAVSNHSSMEYHSTGSITQVGSITEWRVSPD